MWVVEESPRSFPVGIVGRVGGGRYDGFFIEVDDDTQRPGGTGGFYLYWSGSEGYDNWVESEGEVLAFLDTLDIDWMSPEGSTAIPGRHRHGPS
jgi:hypothetical protein